MSLVLIPQNTPPTEVAKVAPKRRQTLQPVSPFVSLLAGGVAGGVEASVTYPFEFAKTRLQLQGEGGTKNPFKFIGQVVRNDGIKSLYTGCSSLVIGTAAKAGVRFLAFDTIKNALSDNSGKLSPGRGIIAGMLAGAAESVTAVTPTERIKTALIDDAKGPKRFRNGFHATKTLVSENGLRELYRGLLSTTMKQSGTSAVRMGSYNVLKEASKARGLPQNTITTFGTGAIAGIVTVYATQPLDTIKTRAQSAAGARTSEAFLSIIRQSGVRGFWKGSSMRLGRLVFSGGIVFSVYEQVVSLFAVSRVDQE